MILRLALARFALCEKCIPGNPVPSPSLSLPVMGFQYYRSENAEVANGALAITAKKEDYSSRQGTGTQGPVTLLLFPPAFGLIFILGEGGGMGSNKHGSTARMAPSCLEDNVGCDAGVLLVPLFPEEEQGPKRFLWLLGSVLHRFLGFV